MQTSEIIKGSLIETFMATVQIKYSRQRNKARLFAIIFHNGILVYQMVLINQQTVKAIKLYRVTWESTWSVK